MFHVYVLRSSRTGRRYVGSCEDLDERVRRHNLGHSKATRHGIPWTLIQVKDFVVAPKLRRKSATISQVEVAMNLINCDGSAVAAATGRGFESRRPDLLIYLGKNSVLRSPVEGR